MSKFFGGGSSSTESYSDSESSAGPAPLPSRWAADSDSDSDSERRVVRSAKDKAFDELQGLIKTIKDKVSIKDWSAVQDEYKKLDKGYTKWEKKVLTNTGTPKFYLKFLIDFQNSIDALQGDKAQRMKLSKANAKSFNSMRATMKKALPKFQSEIDRIDEVESDEDSADSAFPDDSDSDSDLDRPGAGSSDSAGAGRGNDDDARRSRWFKKDDDDGGFEQVSRKRKPKGPRKEKAAAGGADGDAEKKKEEEWTEEKVEAERLKILAERGRKGTSPQQLLEKLIALKEHSQTERQTLQMMVSILASRFDLDSNLNTCMPTEIWTACFAGLKEIIDRIEADKSIVFDEGEDGTSDEVPPMQEGEDAADGRIQASLKAFVDRLDTELTKSLQSLDPHTDAYHARLQAEAELLILYRRVQEYYTRLEMLVSASRISVLRIERLYYKLLGEGVSGPEGSDDDVAKLLDTLTVLVYLNADDRSKMRVMLCHIFHHALRGNFFKARDMLLMSHLQDSVQYAEIPTQILYNRVMVQMGVCAFRNDLVREAHSCMSEICSSGRIKELLAQGMSSSRYHERNLEQERLEKRRQVPFHMHVSLELLESVHLICAMLLEVPNMAAAAYDPRRRVISKTFRRLLEHNARQMFTGQPENVREHVMAASTALKKGLWTECDRLLRSMSFWALLRVSDEEVASLKDKLTLQMKTAGLRTYLFAFSTMYDAISLNTLSTMFEMESNHAHSVISKMMIAEELRAYWDQPTQCVVMHKVEPTRLQFLAMELSGKAAHMVEQNERYLDQRTGGQFRDKDGKDKGGDRRHWSNVGGQDRGNYRSRGGGRGRGRGRGGHGNNRNHHNKGHHNKGGRHHGGHRGGRGGRGGGRGGQKRNAWGDRSKQW